MLQEAWRTLIATAPSSELQQALTTQLLDGFFELAGTPATQSLDDSFMFRADLDDQVADQLMLCCLSGKSIVQLLFFGHRQSAVSKFTSGYRCVIRIYSAFDDIAYPAESCRLNSQGKHRSKACQWQQQPSKTVHWGPSRWEQCLRGQKGCRRGTCHCCSAEPR